MPICEMAHAPFNSRNEHVNCLISIKPRWLERWRQLMPKPGAFRKRSPRQKRPARLRRNPGRQVYCKKISNCSICTEVERRIGRRSDGVMETKNSNNQHPTSKKEPNG